MKLPKEILIGGLLNKVIVIPHETDNSNDLGSYSYSQCTIYIKDYQCEPQKRATLLHEMMEAINIIYSIGLKHVQIELLETALLSLEAQFYFDKKS